MLVVVAFGFPRNHHVAEHLPADRKQQMDSLVCFACTCGFALPGELSLAQPMSSHTFTFPVLSRTPPGESELRGAELPG